MKKFSQQAAANFVPLLARIILFLAFVPVGWHHAMDMGAFSGDAAARLRELGVVAVAAPATANPVSVQQVSLSRLPSPQEDFAAAGATPARALHELTLTLDRLRLPKPHVWAWTITVFELVGGALLVVGLLSRLWAGGLALWTIALVALTTPSLRDSWSAIWATTDPAAVLPRALILSQLGIFALALGLTLTGPGRWSLDGLIFRGKGGDDAEDGDE